MVNSGISRGTILFINNTELDVVAAAKVCEAQEQTVAL
jgi:hypothetical protein